MMRIGETESDAGGERHLIKDRLRHLSLLLPPVDDIRHNAASALIALGRGGKSAMQSRMFTAAAVALAYFLAAWASRTLSDSQLQAQSVWLSSGIVLGLLLRRPVWEWTPVLAGGAIGAFAFGWWSTSSIANGCAVAFIEVVATGLAAFLTQRMVPPPVRLDSPLKVAAFCVAGALGQALASASLGSSWFAWMYSTAGVAEFRVWLIANFVGALLIVPFILAWADFRPKRSGGLPMPRFLGGAIAFVLFLVAVLVVFDVHTTERFVGSTGMTITYPPAGMLVLVALLWGVRGSTLALLIGIGIALHSTARGEGPFAAIRGFFDEDMLEVQGYAAAVCIGIMLVSALVASQEKALAAAREWRTRFEAVTGAHRLLTYEWDPVSGSLRWGGAVQEVFGPKGAAATLSDWLARVETGDRDRVRRVYEDRVHADGTIERYGLVGTDGEALSVSDEARRLLDHDGTLHRVVGLIRVSAG